MAVNPLLREAGFDSQSNAMTADFRQANYYLDRDTTPRLI
jgi:hypothetical protein